MSEQTKFKIGDTAFLIDGTNGIIDAIDRSLQIRPFPAISFKGSYRWYREDQAVPKEIWDSPLYKALQEFPS